MNPRPAALRLARAAHRLSSRALLPRGFREAFGPELDETFDALAEDAYEAGGTRRLLAVTVRVIADDVRVALVRRRELTALDGVRTPDRQRPGGTVEGVLSVLRDAGVGLRMLARRPVFTLVAVGTLALGIGANAAIFSVVNAVLIRPLPFPEPHELVRVYHVDAESGNRRGSFSLPDREDLAELSTSLDAVAVYTTLPSGLLLTGGDEATEVRTAYVSAGFFDVLGRDARLGRVLSDAEERGDNAVVVLSHAFWERRFGGDERVVGGTIGLDDQAVLVAGVMPPDFVFPSPDVEAWVYLTIIPESSIPLDYREVRFLEAIARVRDGISLAQAESEVSSVARALAGRFPEENENLEATALVPLRDSMTASVSTSLLVLLGAVGLVLLIACGNVANLLLSRGIERAREIEIRRALGAGRRRLIRQLMTESVLLSGLGTIGGVLLAYGATGWLIELSDGLLPRSGEVRIDGAVLLFSLLVAVLTAVGFGLAPALNVTRAGRTSSSTASRSGARRPGARRRWGVLTGAQVALATVLVITAGLLLRGLWSLQRVEVGLDADRLVALNLTISDARYPERVDYLAAYERLLDRLRTVPGVEDVASIRHLPLRRTGETTEFRIPGRPERADRTERASALQVSPGFFRVAGVPLLAGREFTDADRADGTPVVMVNDAMRRRYWPGANPVGETIIGASDTPVEIVGLVGDIRQTGLADDPEPTLYVPQAQSPRRGMAFLVRTAGNPDQLVPLVRTAVREVDPDQPIEQLASMATVVRASTARPRFFSSLLGCFAALAMLLAAFGIYGVVSNSVNRRVSEIGIRVALGASRGEVLGMILREGMAPVALGALAGVTLSLASTRLLRSLLYGVSATDLATFATVPVLLMAAALLACWVPATRAVRIDPTEALRAE